MRGRYNNFELCCALKPFISEFLLLSENKIDKLFYFDSDILVFDALTGAIDLLNSHAVLITPHLLQPIKDDGFFPKEESIIFYLIQCIIASVLSPTFLCSLPMRTCMKDTIS